mmetsp:Transcript_15888/g.35035  ORF Transcript_15888/g.35035 Transcript_15888/m.35035 type:complete len:330 (+) Transcript_15888:467-1456(+)
MSGYCFAAGAGAAGESPNNPPSKSSTGAAAGVGAEADGDGPPIPNTSSSKSLLAAGTAVGATAGTGSEFSSASTSKSNRSPCPPPLATRMLGAATSPTSEAPPSGLSQTGMRSKTSARQASQSLSMSLEYSQARCCNSADREVSNLRIILRILSSSPGNRAASFIKHEAMISCVFVPFVAGCLMIPCRRSSTSAEVTCMGWSSGPVAVPLQSRSPNSPTHQIPTCWRASWVALLVKLKYNLCTVYACSSGVEATRWQNIDLTSGGTMSPARHITLTRLSTCHLRLGACCSMQAQILITRSSLKPSDSAVIRWFCSSLVMFLTLSSFTRA